MNLCEMKPAFFSLCLNVDPTICSCAQEELEQEDINGFENRVKEKERKKKQKEKERKKKDASSIDCATEEPDEFQEFDDCSDEDEIGHLGTFSHCYAED